MLHRHVGGKVVGLLFFFGLLLGCKTEKPQVAVLRGDQSPSFSTPSTPSTPQVPDDGQPPATATPSQEEMPTTPATPVAPAGPITPAVPAVPTKGKVKVSVQKTDATIGFEKILISVREISVRNVETGWLDLPTAPLTLDLLATETPLTLTDLAPGNYDEVRLKLSDSATGVLNGRNIAIEIPSGSTSGLKLKGAFTVVTGATTSVTLVFDPEKSVKQAGKKYQPS
jgi:hypothetical protein